MIDNIQDFKVGIIGGGRRCKALLEAFFSEPDVEKRPEILAVADKDAQAAGLQYANEKGIFTTDDFSELFTIEDIDLLLELTPDDSLRAIIQDAKPPGVLLLDHYEARSILDFFRIDAKKNEVLEKIRANQGDIQATEDLFEQFHQFVQDINSASNTYARETRQSLVTSEWTMSQIINGSTIPTFVINTDHRVTHWNRACEKLTGHPARQMIGTDDQWKPFRSDKRPTMADLILDGVSEEKLWQLYGTRWEKSALIGGGFEVEEFFSHLGPEGTWLFFTAVPIKDPEGNVVGAIETLWDRTRQKQAEDARESKNKELAAKVEELSANERAMSQIINGSTIPTFVIDKTHRVTHWNKALERLSGHQSRDIVGTTRQWAPFYDRERPSMADVILDQIDETQIRKLYGTKWRKSVLIEGAYEAEVYFPKLGDSGKWCWFTAAPIKTSEGRVVGAIETVWDKTEDRQAEKEREQHTKELATFCSVYATLSGPLSLEGRIKAAIEEVANIFELDGFCIFILKPDWKFHLKYSSGYSENLCYHNRCAGEDSNIVRVARKGQTMVFKDLSIAGDDEMVMLRKEGLKSLVCIPILDKNKNTFGVVRAASKNAGHFDGNDVRALELITNRIGVAIENALLQEDVKRKANFQARLIGSSNDGIVATDDQWNVVVFNPAAENVFGFSSSEVIGRMDARDIFPSHIVEAFDQVLAAGTKGGNIAWQETTIGSKADESIPVLFSGTILREKHKMMGIVAFFHDLRDIKRLEKELVNAERLAAVGQTVAGMAHCVKNILHGLKGGSYLVNIGIEKGKTDKLKNGWQMVQRNIGRTSDLVQDLLSYSKEREPEFEPTAANDIADEVCELMQEVAKENDVAIEKDFSSEIGEVMLDPRSLYRSLLNLVSNAIDACRDDPTPGKSHFVTVTTGLDGDQFIRFEVRDNGSGMSDEVKSKLFSSFFSTKGPQGTGLGLLVTSKLIEEHNGRIDVSSQLGEGTTFILRLPLKIVDPD